MNSSSNADPSKAVVLVCGMHRSGTSAFTRVCNLLGGTLPEPLVEPAIGNELGLWEPAAVVAMNDRALLAAGSDVNSVFPVSPQWLQSPAGRQVVEEVSDYIGGLGDAARTWFIKDPRISVLAGLWREGVERSGVRPRFVIAFRNPWEVAVSLCARQLHHFPDEVWPLERGLALWLHYTLTIERASRGFPRSFVSYEGFLGDWRGEVARIYSQLGLPQPALDEASQAEIQAFLQPGERHARYDAAQARTGLAMRVYAMLQDQVSNPEAGREAFDEAGVLFAESLDLLGGYVGALEERARQVPLLKARASSAEAEADDLRKAAETARLREIHLTRAAEARDAPGLEGADDDYGLLRKKHDALSAAHRENLLAYRAETARLGAEIDRRQQAFDLSLADKDQIHASRLAEHASTFAEKERLFASTLAEKDRTIAAFNESLGRPAASVQPLADATAELDLIRRSTSWRITKPLRAAATLLKGR